MYCVIFPRLRTQTLNIVHVLIAASAKSAISEKTIAHSALQEQQARGRV